MGGSKDDTVVFLILVHVGLMTISSCDMHHLRFGLSRRLVGGSKDDTVVFLTLYVDCTKLGAHNLQYFLLF